MACQLTITKQGLHGAVLIHKFISNSIGSLFSKSYFFSQEIHEAMISRGYKGEPVIINRFKLTLFDIQWTIIILIFILLLFGGEIALG